MLFCHIIKLSRLSAFCKLHALLKGLSSFFERCSAPLRQTDLCLSRCQHEFVASVRSSACLLIGWPKVACLVIGWPKRCPYSRTWGPFPWRPHAQLPQSWPPLHFSPLLRATATDCFVIFSMHKALNSPGFSSTWRHGRAPRGRVHVLDIGRARRFARLVIVSHRITYCRLPLLYSTPCHPRTVLHFPQ